MSLSSNFPTIRPSLLLDFANVGRLDPRVTFTRASTATYYDGVTTAKAEENLLLQSQALTTSPWTVTSLNAVGSKTAPDGTATAIEITATGTNGRTRQTVTVVSGQTYTHSMFVRRVTGSGNVTLAILDSGGTALFSTVMSLTSDWQRFTVSGAPAVTSIQAGIIIATSTDAVEVWGAQLEQRSSVTAYTATTTQAITNYIPVLLTAQNDVPRFDHNPTTGAALGLLIEEQRTNLESYSDDFSNAFWSKSNVTVSSNVIIAPDGNLTGDKLITDSGLITGQVFATTTLAASTTYTFSCFAKAGEWSWTNLATRGPENIDIGAWFNLSAGTVGTVSAGVTASITPVGNGWYRCAVTRTTGTGATASRQRIHSTNADNAYSTGDGYSGIYIWGAQLEAGSFATSYIPTTTTALTRNADVASMTGTNFSSWYNASEGVLYSQSQQYADRTGGFPVVTGVTDSGDGQNCIEHYWGNSTSSFGGIVYVSAAIQAALSTSGLTRTAVQKYAFAYKANDFASSLNGAAVSTDGSGTIPVVDRLVIGGRPTGGRYSGYIQRIAYYPTRLTNAQLQALTG